MKKLAFIAICLTSTLGAFAQDEEKHEAPQEVTVSPVVVHDDVQKTITIEAPFPKVQINAAKPVAEIPVSTNENTPGWAKLAGQNIELLLFGVAALTYLLFVWFLSYASRTPAIAMSITRGLYYIVGLPVVMTFLSFRLLRRAFDTQQSNHQSGLEKITRQSGENSNSFNNSISDRNHSRDQQSSNSGSREIVKNQNDASNGERIVVQVNLNDRWYNRVTMPTSSSSGQISKKLQEVAHGERNKKDFHGRVRAIGEQSNRVYDIIS